MAIFITFGLFNLCFKSRTVSARELTFAGYAGMIRGAVAFALVMKIPHYGGHGCPKNSSIANSNCFGAEEFEMIVTTTIILVIVSTVFLSTFMAAFGRLMVPPSNTGTDDHMEFDNGDKIDESHHHVI